MREEYLSLSKVLPSRTDAFQITLSAIILPIITCTVVATSSIYTLSYIVHHLDLDHHDVGVLRWIVGRKNVVIWISRVSLWSRSFSKISQTDHNRRVFWTSKEDINLRISLLPHHLRSSKQIITLDRHINMDIDRKFTELIEIIVVCQVSLIPDRLARGPLRPPIQRR